jgi:hypothetical protein
MLNSKNEQQAQSVGIETTDYYSKLVENCTISEQTGKFLACILSLSDLFSKVYEAVMFMYGERADEIINNGYYQKSNELELVLYDFLRYSINDKLDSETINEI